MLSLSHLLFLSWAFLVSSAFSYVVWGLSRCLWTLGDSRRAFRGKEKDLPWVISGLIQSFHFPDCCLTPHGVSGDRKQCTVSGVAPDCGPPSSFPNRCIAAGTLDGLQCVRVSSKQPGWFLKQVIFTLLFCFLPEAFNRPLFFIPFSVAFNHLSPDHQGCVSSESVLSPEFSQTHTKWIC